MSNRPAFDPLNNRAEMAAMISDVTGTPVEQVIERLEHERRRPGSSVREDFQRTGGKMYEWGPQLEAFYSSTDAFIYELAVWNRNPLKIGMRKWVGRDMRRVGEALDVLGIGDGLGFDCLHLARKGHRVTYFELPGLSEQFARKLFERTGSAINVLTDPASIPVGAFDAITCLDVLEHVPDPPAMVATLASYLRPGGRLYASAPFYLVLPWYPTHLRSNRRYSGSLRMYRKAGLRLEGGRFGWNPVVLRKPESPTDEQPEPMALAARLSVPMLRAGRRASWPFVPLHFLRRVFSRPFAKQ